MYVQGAGLRSVLCELSNQNVTQILSPPPRKYHKEERVAAAEEQLQLTVGLRRLQVLPLAGTTAGALE